MNNKSNPHKVCCAVHPDVELTCTACFGARGGAAGTEAQRRAAKENGKLGGRPKGSRNKAKLASS